MIGPGTWFVIVYPGAFSKTQVQLARPLALHKRKTVALASRNRRFFKRAGWSFPSYLQYAPARSPKVLKARSRFSALAIPTPTGLSRGMLLLAAAESGFVMYPASAPTNMREHAAPMRLISRVAMAVQSPLRLREWPRGGAISAIMA